MPQRAPGAGTTIGSINTGSGKVVIRRMEGVQTPILNHVFNTAGSFLRRRYPGTFGDTASISLGNRSIPIQQTGLGLPQVLSVNTGTSKVTLPHVPIGTDTTQNQGIVPMSVGPQVVSSWFDYHKLKAAGVSVKHISEVPAGTATTPVISDVAATPPGIFPTKTTSGGSMDLGALITDLGTAYIKTKYAPQPTGSFPTVQPAYSLPELGGDIIDYFTDPATGTVVPVKAKKKPCRRRRRRLATKSDLGDLAALKAILGNGEAFKAWIATHSR